MGRDGLGEARVAGLTPEHQGEAHRGRSALGSSALHQLAQNLEAVGREAAQRASRPLAHVLAVHRQGHAHLAHRQVDLPHTQTKAGYRGNQGKGVTAPTESKNRPPQESWSRPRKCYGGPQGSVLGPIPLTIYLLSLGNQTQLTVSEGGALIWD